VPDEEAVVDDSPIGIPPIRYDEIGWEFAMRPANHFSTTGTPEPTNNVASR
jgi:hypothetical protein